VTDRGRTVVAYVRTIAAALERVRGRSNVLSERDWDLANRWHDRGIPVGLVLEILEERRHRPPRSLAAVATRVEESWSAVESGQRSPGGATLPSTAPEPGDSWRAALTAGGLPEGIAEVVRTALAELELGEDPREVGERLDDALAQAAPPEILREIAARVDGDLAPYRGRMPAAMMRSTRDKAIANALRGVFGLRGC